MKKALVTLAMMLAVLIGAALGAPYLVPGSILKSWAIALGERLVGYPIAIAGPFRIALFPRLTIEASDVRIASHRAGRPDLLSAAKVEIVAELAAPPLSGVPIRISKAVMVDLVARLAIDAEGRSNWDAERDPRAMRMRQAALDPEWLLKSVFGVAEIRLSNGRIVYEDARDKRRIEASRLEGSTRAPGQGPFAARARMIVNGQDTAIAVEAGSVKGLLSGSNTSLTAGLQAPAAKFEYRGSVAWRQSLIVDGEAVFVAGSMQALQAWLGRLFPGPALGPIQVRGRIVSSGNRVAMEQLRVEFGTTKATGEVALVFARAGPGLQLALTADTLDLSPFVDADALGRWRPSGAPFPVGQDGDANIQLAWRGLRLGPLRLGPGEFGARLARNDRILEVELNDIALFGGNLRGQMRLGMAPGKGSLEGRIELHRVAAADALGMVIDPPPLNGLASMTVDLSAIGPSPVELLRSLRVQGTFGIVDGTLLDPRLAGAVKGEGEAGTAQYQYLMGSFSAVAGILKSPDVVFHGGKVNLAGSGEIDLSRGSIEFVLKPVGATIAGAGNEAKAGAVTEEIRVSGPWGNIAVERRPP